uniref:Uncharacterized protein n=1 Tax=Glossina palpalis gambiensis TaxID=67801 RepID=A0A1B0BWW0_9MUSC
MFVNEEVGSLFQQQHLARPSRNQLKQLPFAVNRTQDSATPIVNSSLGATTDHNNKPRLEYLVAVQTILMLTKLRIPVPWAHLSLIERNHFQATQRLYSQLMNK